MEELLEKADARFFGHMQIPADRIHSIETSNNKSHLLLKKEHTFPYVSITPSSTLRPF